VIGEAKTKTKKRNPNKKTTSGKKIEELKEKDNSRGRGGNA